MTIVETSGTLESTIDIKKNFQLPSHSSPGCHLRARARRALLQDKILAWSKSEGNFDFKISDSWPQKYHKIGKQHWKFLFHLLVDLLRVIYRNLFSMSFQNNKIYPLFGLYLENAGSYWLKLGFIC